MTSRITLYEPLNSPAEAFRVLWAFEGERRDADGAQTISVPLVDQGDGNVPTIGTLKAWTARMCALRGGGLEAAVLVPVALSLMLYPSSQEPDLDEIPPSRLARPQQLADATVANLGRRIGSALRSYRQSAAASGTGRAARSWWNRTIFRC